MSDAIGHAEDGALGDGQLPKISAKPCLYHVILGSSRIWMIDNTPLSKYEMLYSNPHIGVEKLETLKEWRKHRRFRTSLGTLFGIFLGGC